jgi:HAD superfamily hydrolase (TIGR01509 family)
MHTKAIIFDCDGTLIDSERLYAQANAQVYQDCGLDVSADFLLAEYTGIGLKIVVPILEARFGVHFPADIFARLEASSEKLLAQELNEISGVSILLESLKNKQIPIAVASNSTLPHIRYCLKKTGLIDFFDPAHIWGSDRVAHPKPNPDLYLAAANSLGIDANRCVAVEDSPTGVQAALAAGMYVVGFSDAKHPYSIERLMAAGAHDVITDMSALLIDL